MGLFDGIIGANSSLDAAHAIQGGLAQGRDQLTQGYNTSTGNINTAYGNMMGGYGQGYGLANQALQQGYGNAAGYQQPLYGMGMAANQQAAQGVLSGAYNNPQYSYNPSSNPLSMPQAAQSTQQAFNFQQQPGYQFQLQQGLGAVNAQQAGQGLGLSGATQKALMQYGTGLANQSYNTAFQQNLAQNQQAQSVQNQGFNQYANQQQFGAGQALTQYQAGAQNQAANYQRMMGVGQLGTGAANTLSSLGAQQGQLGAQYGSQYGQNMANAGQWQGTTLSGLATQYGQNMAQNYGAAGQAEAQGLYGYGQGMASAANSLGQSAGNMFGQNGQGMNLSSLAAMLG